MSFGREVRKVLKARIQFPRDHSVAGERNSLYPIIAASCPPKCGLDWPFATKWARDLL
jgi:hypothetical protein